MSAARAAMTAEAIAAGFNPALNAVWVAAKPYSQSGQGIS
ncbi:phosphohistidine phosphatase SixA [Nesterenkonia xinjiangensis]|uniref:Phosphohistidine phosphatase SixA n=1 Tax=Nesterenkonia xinjiangensis TaxID=225327 RepID=A0A7Z0GNU3_9MICC|nr:phosphohistidine phosphatase SixA [Nesterenkonia xinjiangensis]